MHTQPLCDATVAEQMTARSLHLYVQGYAESAMGLEMEMDQSCVA